MDTAARTWLASTVDDLHGKLVTLKAKLDAVLPPPDAPDYNAMIATVEELDATATPGPWGSSEPSPGDAECAYEPAGVGLESSSDTVCYAEEGVWTPDQVRANMSLIAEFRTICPHLARRVRELGRALAEQAASPMAYSMILFAANKQKEAEAKLRAAVAESERLSERLAASETALRRAIRVAPPDFSVAAVALSERGLHEIQRAIDRLKKVRNGSPVWSVYGAGAPDDETTGRSRELMMLDLVMLAERALSPAS